MHLHVGDVEAASSDGLFGKHTRLGGELEGRDEGVFDFVEVLCSLDCIDQDVGSFIVGTEAPYLQSVSLVPVEILGQPFGSGLDVSLGIDLLAFYHFKQLFIKRS